jgi:uncharacterized membrane protein YwaF
MFEKLTLDQSWNYHVAISWIMCLITILFIFLGFYLNKSGKTDLIKKISFYIIVFCLFQEFIDYFHRAFLDPNYIISWQKDLPFHFCHIAFYFSLIAIYLKLYSNSNNSMSNSSMRTQFLFDVSFILGLSGALQGIFTPDFQNIHNFVGILCGHLQHSLIILNVFWLIFAYKMRLQLNGAIYTYFFINLIVPIAILINYILGYNSNGDRANYLYIMELPTVDNFLLNFVIDKSFPNFIFYIQPLIIMYIIILYIPFFILNRYIYSR